MRDFRFMGRLMTIEPGDGSVPCRESLEIKRPS